MKQIICFFLGHKWTSKAMKGIPPKQPLSIDGFRDHRRMYCDRCKTESILNKLLPLILLLCCLVGCVNAQDSTDIKIYNGPRSLAPLKFTTGVIVDSVSPIKYDTVRCLLLMSDTTHQKYSGANRLRKVDGYALNFQVSTDKQIHLLFWDYGYVVKSIYGIRFLNYTKQPKGKNIVVWQYIEFEQKQKPF